MWYISSIKEFKYPNHATERYKYCISESKSNYLGKQRLKILIACYIGIEKYNAAMSQFLNILWKMFTFSWISTDAVYQCYDYSENDTPFFQ